MHTHGSEQGPHRPIQCTEPTRRAAQEPLQPREPIAHRRIDDAKVRMCLRRYAEEPQQTRIVQMRISEELLVHDDVPLLRRYVLKHSANLLCVAIHRPVLQSRRIWAASLY